MDDTGGLQREGRTRYIFGRDQFNRRVQTIQKHALQHTRLVLGSKQGHLALAWAIVDGAAIKKTRLGTFTEQLRTGIKSSYSGSTSNIVCKVLSPWHVHVVIVDIEQLKALLIAEKIIAKLDKDQFSCINFFVIWILVTNKSGKCFYKNHCSLLIKPAISKESVRSLRFLHQTTRLLISGPQVKARVSAK